MTVEGIVQNGVVILPAGSRIPEGTAVSVTVAPQPTSLESDRMSDDQRRTLLAALDAIAALPSENPGDNFSGADHDRILYGEP